MCNVNLRSGSTRAAPLVLRRDGIHKLRRTEWHSDGEDVELRLLIMDVDGPKLAIKPQPFAHAAFLTAG